MYLNNQIQFGNTYSVMMQAPDKVELKSEMNNLVESNPDQFKQITSDRYVMNVDTPDDYMGLSTGEKVTFDFSAENISDLVMVNLETNYAPHEKTNDLVLVANIKEKMAGVINNAEGVVFSLVDTILEQMDMAQIPKQELYLNHKYNPFEVIPPDVLANVNAENFENRRPIDQALKYSDYKLSKALLLHPQTIVYGMNTRGFDIWSYFSEYTGPHKEELKQLILRKTA